MRSGTLSMAKTNQDYTTIKSPVKGVIIARRMNVGQTAVAGMNAPSLFLLAKDLSRMQVWAQVNEADIGPIHVAMPVHFTLATYPGETFEGKVSQMRLNAQNTQNVVTYTVVVATDNPPTAGHPYGKIFPYMTADLKFEVERHRTCCWCPTPRCVGPRSHWRSLPTHRHARSARHRPGRGRQRGSGRRQASRQPARRRGERAGKHKRLWVNDGDFVRPVKVVVGASDGSMTEVSGEGVKEGMEVVIGESRNAAPTTASDTNPFIPNIRPGAQPKPKQHLSAVPWN